MNQPLFVGTTLYGYCEGYFGEWYEDKVIEAIGWDWLVVRGKCSGEVGFANFYNSEAMCHQINEWSRKPNDIS